MQAAPAVMALMLVRWQPSAIGWGLWRLVRGERALAREPGLRFARVMGSGEGGGFGLKPGMDHQGLIAFFDTDQQAENFVLRSRWSESYREHAAEVLSAVFRATQARGSWAGFSLAPTTQASSGEPLAALTRASISLRHARRFWRHSPATHRSLLSATGCRLAAGLGEAPLLRQATVSLWDSGEAMDSYARQGAHQRAIEGAWREGWFSESMFVRLKPLLLQGSWQGRRHG